MTYIFDTNIFINFFKHYYPEIFSNLWKKFDYLVQNKQILSVREAYNEIVNETTITKNNKTEDDPCVLWAKNNRLIFEKPTFEETEFIAELFIKKPQYQQGFFSKQTLLSNRPVADPYIVAKAKIMNACVVTIEGYNKFGILKDNAHKIPHACKDFNIECMHLQGFMKAEGWKF